VNYRCRQQLRHVAARWMRSPTARPRGHEHGAAEGAVLEHVGTVNTNRGRRAAEGVEMPRGRRGGQSPRTMVMRGLSPWTTTS
jgi:hypothetical protein